MINKIITDEDFKLPLITIHGLDIGSVVVSETNAVYMVVPTYDGNRAFVSLANGSTNSLKEFYGKILRKGAKITIVVGDS